MVPNSKERVAVWSKFGEDIPDLRNVAVRLHSAHATSAASERDITGQGDAPQHLHRITVTKFQRLWG
jgi:hypothetical protein